MLDPKQLAGRLWVMGIAELVVASSSNATARRAAAVALISVLLILVLPVTGLWVVSLDSLVLRLVLAVAKVLAIFALAKWLRNEVEKLERLVGPGIYLYGAGLVVDRGLILVAIYRAI